MEIVKLLITSLSLLTLGFIGLIPQAAKAAVSCETNTVNNYSNGSLANCVLSIDANIGLSNNYFVCQQKETISFDEKGQFSTCTLARDLLLRKGNQVTTCQAEGKVYVTIMNSGNQEITCSRTVANQ